MTSITLTPTDAIDQVWSFVVDLAETIAGTSSGRVNANNIREFLRAGTMQLWIVLGERGEALAVAVTEIVVYPGRKVCVVRGLAGNDRDRWLHHLAEIEAWAKTLECSRIEVRGRKGMARILRDYRLTAVFLEKEI